VRRDPDPYLILGVPQAATQAEIAQAYRARLRAHHPDTRASQPSPPGSDERLRQILAAYAVLRDPARRAEYDRETADPVSTRPHGSTVPTSTDHRATGRVDIPITHRRTSTSATSPPLWAGPVHRHL
jgi:curved DNA-binding protein CbpA